MSAAIDIETFAGEFEQEPEKTAGQCPCQNCHAMSDHLTSTQECTTCGRQFSEQGPFAICPGCAFGEALPSSATNGDVHDSADGVSSNESNLPRIENYTVLEQIGEGGFAIVYRARETGDFPRIVALKVLKRGMDTERIIKRFAIERRALAAMDHPNIATVLGGGKTDGGRPYFVMELVEGTSVIRFSRENSLPLQQRLKLFLDICHGVQHAHQKGIIHRDLKPGNILVASIDGHLAPKIIDFGIAKALDRDGNGESESEAPTRAGEWLGTPAYMSPEQLSPDQGAADTRSDVYSLGVVLYELLTGVQYQARSETEGKNGAAGRTQRDDARRVPGSALATRISSRKLRGELDWVVDKALTVDPSQRYQSVSAMAEDIECYLSGQPVRARPASSLYLIRKAMARHKKGLAVAAAFGVILCASGIGVMRQRMNTLQAQQEAEAITVLFKDLRDTLENRLGPVDLEKQVSVTIAYYNDLRKSGALVPTKSSRIFYSDLWMKLGKSYREQGETMRARTAYIRALAEREALRNDFPDDENVVSILSGVHSSLARVAMMDLALEEALSHYQATLKLNRRCLMLDPGERKYENNLASTNTSLGVCLYQLGKVEASRQCFQNAIRIRGKLARGMDDSSQARADLSDSLYSHAVQSLETGTGIDKLPGLAGEIVRIREERVKARPDDLKRLAALGKILSFRAEVALASGDSRLALSQLKTAESFWSELRGLDGADRRIAFGNELTQTRIRLASAALSNADPELARTALADAEEGIGGQLNPPFMHLRFYLASGALAVFDKDWRSCEQSVHNAEAEVERLLKALPNHPLLKMLQLELEHLRSLQHPSTTTVPLSATRQARP